MKIAAAILLAVFVLWLCAGGFDYLVQCVFGIRAPIDGDGD